MTTKDQADNRAYCKAYYERIKKNPAKLAALRERRARNQRERRARAKPVVTEPSAKPGAAPVTTWPARKPYQAPISRQPSKTMDVLYGRHVTAPGDGSQTDHYPQDETALTPEDIVRRWLERWAADEEIDERAAIMEFDGGLTREQAEKAAGWRK